MSDPTKEDSEDYFDDWAGDNLPSDEWGAPHVTGSPIGFWIRMSEQSLDSDEDVTVQPKDEEQEDERPIR